MEPDAEFERAELGPKMQACTKREREFVFNFVRNGGNGTKAVRDAPSLTSHPGTSRVTAHNYLHRERVLDAIDEVGRQAFRGLLVPAITAMRLMIENRNHPDHARAVTTVLSRLGLGERAAVDVNVAGSVEVNHTQAAIEQLRALRDLGVPQEKLVDIFGFSGLSRYQKMLDELDRGKPKLIEGEVVSRETGGG